MIGSSAASMAQIRFPERARRFPVVLTVALALACAACGSTSSSRTTTARARRTVADSTTATVAAGQTGTGTGTGTGTATTPLPGAGKPTVTIGDKNYTEQFVLGQLYLQALQAQGFTDLNPNIGPTEVTVQALSSGTLGMYPEYLDTFNTAIAGDQRT